jgi:hypothetical protein
MSPFWIWMQAAIVVFVLAGIIIAAIRLLRLLLVPDDRGGNGRFGDGDEGG